MVLANCHQGVYAQNFFRGGIVAGLNLSQIDGDQLAGYDKFGITAGAKVEFPINQSFDMAFEFLLSQRGSRSSLIPGRFTDIRQIHLNYAELPVIIQWNDWWVEEDGFYRIHLRTGVSGARLINSRTNFSSTVINGSFADYDISLFLGGGFSFSKHSTVSLRYTRSLNRLYTFESTTQQEFQALIGYFISIRTEYFF